MREGVSILGGNEFKMSYAMLATIAVLASLSSSILQEHVFRIPDFKFSEFVTFFSSCSNCILGAVEMKLTRTSRKATWLSYGAVSCLTFGGLALTNLSLRYLDYTTRTIFKAGKIIPVMFFSYLALKRKYDCHLWASASLLVVGLVCFTIGDSRSNSRFDTWGVVLIIGATASDALAAIFEEKFLFKVASPASSQEVLCYTYLLGSVYGIIILLLSPTTPAGILFFQAYPTVILRILAFSTLNYLSVKVILVLISRFGATEAEIVKYLRRYIVIFGSFLIYRKPINAAHVCGFIAVSLSSAVHGVSKWTNRAAKVVERSQDVGI